MDIDIPVFQTIFLGTVDVTARNLPILAFEEDFPRSAVQPSRIAGNASMEGGNVWWCRFCFPREVLPRAPRTAALALVCGCATQCCLKLQSSATSLVRTASANGGGSLSVRDGHV